MGITVSLDNEDGSVPSLLPSFRLRDAPEVALIDAMSVGPHLSFLAKGFDEVRPRDFYRELFPEGELDRENAFTKGKYVGKAVRIFNKTNKVYRYNVYDDLTAIDKLIETDEFCVMSPVSYAGKSQSQANARYLHAIVFDLDGLMVTEDGQSKTLLNLFAHIEMGLLPKPSHIVFSGTGLHLYYMLVVPIPLFPDVLKSLSAFRTYMVPRIWNYYVSSLSERPQYESVTQGFRMVGTKAKHGRTVRAFRVGEKVTVDYLNGFVYEEPAKISTDYVRARRTRMDEAKEKWPDWYQARIVEGRPRGTWHVKRDLYDWWKRKIREGAAVGHRYFCVMALAVYARKCCVSYEELERDALNLVPFLNSLGEASGAPFSAEDVVKALEAYNASYITFPRATIEKITAISMPANKRNGRPQEQHMAVMRAVQSVVDPDGSWREGNGRKPKRDLIREYAAEHPAENHSQIAKALGVSRTTVIKWLREVE